MTVAMLECRRLSGRGVPLSLRERPSGCRGGIGIDDAQGQAFLLRPIQLRQRDLRLGAKRLAGGHARTLAARLIVSPRFRQIKLQRDRQGGPLLRQRQRNRDLIIQWVGFSLRHSANH